MHSARARARAREREREREKMQGRLIVVTDRQRDRARQTDRQTDRDPQINASWLQLLVGTYNQQTHSAAMVINDTAILHGQRGEVTQ